MYEVFYNKLQPWVCNMRLPQYLPLITSFGRLTRLRNGSGRYKILKRGLKISKNDHTTKVRPSQENIWYHVVHMVRSCIAHCFISRLRDLVGNQYLTIDPSRPSERGFMDTMVNHLNTTEWSSQGHALENGESSGTNFFLRMDLL